MHTNHDKEIARIKLFVDLIQKFDIRIEFLKLFFDKFLFSLCGSSSSLVIFLFHVHFFSFSNGIELLLFVLYPPVFVFYSHFPLKYNLQKEILLLLLVPAMIKFERPFFFVALLQLVSSFSHELRNICFIVNLGNLEILNKER